MLENEDTKLKEYFQNLPKEVTTRLEGDWEGALVQELKRNGIPEKYHESIKDDVFLNLAEIKNPDETCQSIKELLPLDSSSLDSLCADIKYKILVDISPEKEDSVPLTPTESQVGVDIIEERETLEPEVAPMQSSATESSAGVDILQEEKVTEENRPSPAKDSLIQGIEHPEEARDIEDAAEQGKKYNPIKSKLGGSTGNRAPQYKGTDPYREPIE